MARQEKFKTLSFVAVLKSVAFERNLLHIHIRTKTIFYCFSKRGTIQTFPFNLVRFRASVSSDPQRTHPLFELNFFGVSSFLPLLSIRRSKTVDYMSQCTEMYQRIYFTMYGNVLRKKQFPKSFGWARERVMQFRAK